MTDTRRRVKLYALNADRQWDDRGTGHVSSSYVDRLKGTSLLVRAESDGSLLLESKIQPDTAYQKQQETLIVWSEGDNFDLALSFQEKVGCDEIWEKICQVQGKDPSVDITQDVVEESEDERFEDMSDGAPPVDLPACELGKLEEINEVVSSCLPSPIRREKLALVIENEGYIKKLLGAFHMCEDLENVNGLHHLYEIFKNIFLLNKNALFEAMFADDSIFDVVGCLEYDPSAARPKRHRDYLRSAAKFREVIPISNPELLAKIHQTFRVQYIQDVVLPTPSVFEENMLSTLSSFIFFNKMEIVTLIQEDEKFLGELFAQLTDEATDDDKRRELVLFLKEFCTFSQTLQQMPREAFFKTLASLGILQALEITLCMEDAAIKSASIDILSYIVEFSPSMVRDFMLQQVNTQDEDPLLMNIIIEQMMCDSDPELGGAVQLMGIIRILIDPENMMAPVNKSEKTDFLNFFYKHCTQALLTPLLANTGDDEDGPKDHYQLVQLLSLILELLSFCVEHHTYHIKNYILHKDLLRRILVLMKSKHTFLVLCALRFFRKIVGMKDEFYNRYIVKGNLFLPVVEAFKRNDGRYNLLDSAVVELFEFIKVEDIKSLCMHFVENFGKAFDRVEYVQTFKALRQRYDQHQDRLKERPTLDSVPSILRNNRYRRDPRDLDEEEEMWFNQYDDMEDGEAIVPVADVLGKKVDHTELDHVGKMIGGARGREGDVGCAVRTTGSDCGVKLPSSMMLSSGRSTSPGNTANASPPFVDDGNKSVPIPRKGGLVDYEGDSDEDEEDEDEDEEDDENGKNGNGTGNEAASRNTDIASESLSSSPSPSSSASAAAVGSASPSTANATVSSSSSSSSDDDGGNDNGNGDGDGEKPDAGPAAKRSRLT